MLIEIERQQDVCILRLSGRFLAGMETDYVRSRMDDIKSQDCAKMLVDLSGVAAIGSSGIGFIVSLYTSIIKKAGGRFLLAGVNSRVSQVLDITRISTVIPFAGDPASALAALLGEGPRGRATNS